MPDWLNLHVAALVLVAALFGGMLFFAALFAPLVFRKLPKEIAAAFIGDVFPVYYRVMGILALFAALPLVPAQSYMAEVSMLVIVTGGFVVANTVLRPRLEAARAGARDMAFRRLHRTSVIIHLIQFALAAVVLVRLAQ